MKVSNYMNDQEKRKIAFRMTTRAFASMDFVDDYLSSHLNATDSAYLRSLYILLSFAFELILKSRVVVTHDSDCQKCLERKLKNLGHDFIKICQVLGNKELNNVGIKNIESKTASYNNPREPKEEYSYYSVDTVDDKKISIENFNDIRYNFMEGEGALC